MYVKCYEITSDTVGGVKHVKFIPITPGLCWTRICKSPLNYHPPGKSSTNILPSTKKAESLCECLFTRSIWLSYKSPWAKEARFHNMATTSAGSENWQPCLRWRSFIWSYAWGMWLGKKIITCSPVPKCFDEMWINLVAQGQNASLWAHLLCTSCSDAKRPFFFASKLDRMM